MKAILDIEKFNKECCDKMAVLVAEAERKAKKEQQQQKVQKVLNPSKKRKF